MKLVSWFLSIFFLIKTNTKESSHQTGKVRTWFVKYYGGGALVLSEMDGAVWPKPINSDAVKRYYA